MSGISPTPKTLTLRFKIFMTTAVLYAEPTTTLFDLKTELLAALKETCSSGFIETADSPMPLPDSPGDLILGRLIDASNTRGGWERIEEEEHGEQTSSKGKGKAAVARLNGVSKATVASVGLVDGALIAFKFRAEDADSAGEGETLYQEDWDVLLPQREPVDELDEGVADLDEAAEQPPLRFRTPPEAALKR